MITALLMISAGCLYGAVNVIGVSKKIDRFLNYFEVRT